MGTFLTGVGSNLTGLAERNTGNAAAASNYNTGSLDGLAAYSYLSAAGQEASLELI